MSIDVGEQKPTVSMAILEKVSALDKWVTARLEETRIAETRIEAKLSQLGKLEGSLQSMIDSLRKQMTETIPVIHRAATVKEEAKAEIASAIEDALAHARQQAKHLAHEAADEFDAQIKDRIRSAIAGVSVEQMQKIASDVTQRLTEESTHCREQAEQTLILFRQLLAQQVNQIRDQAAAAARPYNNRLNEAREHIDRQIDAMLESSQVTVEQRLEMLARSAESSVELMERNLVGRVKGIRPQVMVEVESTQKMIAHRVAGLIEAAKKMVSTVVKDLDQQLDALPPKAESLREELDERLSTYMKDLQESANTMVGWLEDRVTQRVDDLVDKSRHSMWSELRALNAASDKLAMESPASPMPAAEHPNTPISLTMYVDRLRVKPDPKPAA